MHPPNTIRFFLLASLALLLMAPTSGPRIESLRGRVEIGSGEPPAWRAARPGDLLAPGDRVRTGRDGRAELALPAGSVRLYGDSLLRLPGASMAADGDAVELDAGSSLFDVLKRGARSPFEVRTPEVVVSIKGTRFLVTADERAEVAVYHGTVGLRRGEDHARELLVHAGFLAVGHGGEPFELLVNTSPDPWDNWLENIPPPRAPESASNSDGDVHAALQAARTQSRREALEEALDRHPALADRLTEVGTLKQKDPGEAEAGDKGSLGPGPAAPDPLADEVEKRDSEEILTRYLETTVNGPGGGSSGPGGGGSSGPTLNIDVDDDEVTLELGGSSWTFADDDLEDVVDGEDTFPTPITDAVVGSGSTVTGFAGDLLQLLDDDDDD
jgi:hypothetical protein